MSALKILLVICVSVFVGNLVLMLLNDVPIFYTLYLEHCTFLIPNILCLDIELLVN